MCPIDKSGLGLVKGLSWGQRVNSMPPDSYTVSNEQVLRSDFINYNETPAPTNLNDDVIGFYSKVHGGCDHGYPLTIIRPPRFR